MTFTKYPPDSQESDGGAIHKASHCPDLLSEIQSIAVQLKIFILGFSVFIKISLKFRSACQDQQAGKSVVKCLFLGYNKVARVGFEPWKC